MSSVNLMLRIVFMGVCNSNDFILENCGFRFKFSSLKKIMLIMFEVYINNKN